MMGQAGWFKRNHPGFTPGVERYIEESERLVGVMERRLTGRDFLAGDNLSIADIMYIGWLRVAPDYLGLELSKFPAVAEWRERLLARPGV